MKTYKIWNKLDKINGVEASYVIDSIKSHENDEVFLVIDEYENVLQIEIVRTIKSVYGLEANLTAEQTAQAYLDLKVQEEEKAKQDQITLEQQATKIATLETSQANTEYILMMGGLM